MTEHYTYQIAKLHTKETNYMYRLHYSMYEIMYENPIYIFRASRDIPDRKKCT